MTSMPVVLDGTNDLGVNDNSNNSSILVNDEVTTAAKDSDNDGVDEYLSKDLPIGVEMSIDAIAQRVAKGAPIDYRQVGWLDIVV